MKTEKVKWKFHLCHTRSKLNMNEIIKKSFNEKSNNLKNN